MTQTVTTTTRTPYQGYNPNRSTPQHQGYASRSAPQEQGHYSSSNPALYHEYTPRHNTASQFQEPPQRQEYNIPHNNTNQRQNYDPRDSISPQHQDPGPRISATSQNREHIPRNNATFKSNNQVDAQRASMPQSYQGDLSPSPNPRAYESPSLKDEDDTGLARQNSIPRKQIGTSPNTPYSSVHTSSLTWAQPGQSRQQSSPKPLPSTPVAVSRGYTDRQKDYDSQPSSILNRSRPIPTSQAGPREAQEVVDRAKTNTYDTQVVETVAPG